MCLTIQLMLSSIFNLKILLQTEQQEIHEKKNLGKKSLEESVFIKIFKPYAKDIVKTLLERCFDRFEETDEVLNIFEEILELFSEFLAGEDDVLIN